MARWVSYPHPDSWSNASVIYGSSWHLTAITSLTPVIRRHHHQFQMPSSRVDMSHMLTAYLIRSLNLDVAQLNSVKVCELNEGG